MQKLMCAAAGARNGGKGWDVLVDRFNGRLRSSNRKYFLAQNRMWEKQFWLRRAPGESFGSKIELDSMEVRLVATLEVFSGSWASWSKELRSQLTSNQEGLATVSGAWRVCFVHNLEELGQMEQSLAGSMGLEETPQEVLTD